MACFGEGGQNITRCKNFCHIANSCIIKNQTIQKPTVYKNGNGRSVGRSVCALLFMSLK